MSEILVVGSKVKAFIKTQSGGMNVSGSTLDALSKLVEKKCQEAIENAKRDGRKTVMDRDVGV
jgi:histone H3/H4